MMSPSYNYFEKAFLGRSCYVLHFILPLTAVLSLASAASANPIGGVGLSDYEPGFNVGNFDERSDSRAPPPFMEYDNPMYEMGPPADTFEQFPIGEKRPNGREFADPLLEQQDSVFRPYYPSSLRARQIPSWMPGGFNTGNTAKQPEQDVRGAPGFNGPIVPQFMVDIFNRFDQDKSMQPTSNIIRSFTNIASTEDQQSFTSRSPECAMEALEGGCLSKTLLIFNVSAIPSHEKVTLAELRLFLSLCAGYVLYCTPGHEYTVQATSTFTIAHKAPGLPETEVQVNVQIVEVGCNALRRKPKSPKNFCANTADDEGSYQRVVHSRNILMRSNVWETVKVTSLLQTWLHERELRQLEVHTTVMDFEYAKACVESDATSASEPLLIVFSDDKSKNRRLEKKDEIRELLSHQAPQAPTDDIDMPEKSRKKRRAGEEYSEITVSGMKIAVQLVQPKIHPGKNATHRVKRSSGYYCHREEMFVTFAEIGYDHITNPTSYQAYKCSGECSLPLTGHTTTHAAIQAAAHSRFPTVHEGPCCVPTKLNPISLLYREGGALVYKYQFEGMQVEECGCR